MYRVETFGISDDGQMTMGNTIYGFKTLRAVYECLLNETDMYTLYNDDAEEGYDINLPGIGYVNAATIAKRLFPEEYNAYCDKIYTALAEEAQLFFNDFAADEILQAQGEGYLNRFPSRKGGFVIYQED